MKHILLSTLIGATLSLGSYTTASAQKLPPEVLQPYKDYRAALKAGDSEAAVKAAKKAWKKAEKMLGDHKTTGDLAQNFADVAKAERGLLADKSYDSNLKKAYRRSIELASFYGDESALITLDRIALYSEYLVRSKDRSELETYFERVPALLKATGRENSNTDAYFKTMKGRYYYMSQDYDAALKELDASMDLLKNLSNPENNTEYFIARFWKSMTLKAQGRDIEAALGFQDNMQNLEGKLPEKHPLVTASFDKWLSLMGDFKINKTMDEAFEAGVCECWPFDVRSKSEVFPIQRTPPKMPRNAYQSGHAMVQFDLDDAGKPTNVEVIASTDRMFRQPSVRAVEQWVYPARKSDENPEIRKGLTNKISYRLSDGRGGVFPEPD